MKREEILIEVDELMALAADSAVKIYDATFFLGRPEGEPTAYDNYLQGHIPQAAFFDHQAFSDKTSKYLFALLNDAALATQIGSIGIDNESTVVLYSASDIVWATRAWWILRYAGVNNVRVLNGGLPAWQNAGGELHSGAFNYPVTTFTAAPRQGMFASKEEVQAAINNGQVCTLNALPYEAYAKAHIVGSSNSPCMKLLDSGKAFLPNETIAATLSPTIAGKRVLSYCGGGIAATANAVGCLLAGHENVAVYDGSMSEWTGEQLPVSSV